MGSRPPAVELHHTEGTPLTGCHLKQAAEWKTNQYKNRGKFAEKQYPDDYNKANNWRGLSTDEGQSFIDSPVTVDIVGIKRPEGVGALTTMQVWFQAHVWVEETEHEGKHDPFTESMGKVEAWWGQHYHYQAVVEKEGSSLNQNHKFWEKDKERKKFPKPLGKRREQKKE